MNLIEQFKNKNPAYKDVPVNELAPALYNKYYKDTMTSQEFAGAIVGDGYAKKEVSNYSPNKLEAGIMGAAQSLSYGTADEMAGAVGGGLSFLKGDGFSKGYGDVMEQQSDALKAARDQQGGAMLAGELGGALLGAGAGGGALAASKIGKFLTSGGRIAQAGKGAATGAVSGGAYGLGTGEGGLDKRLESGQTGALFGVAGGAVAPSVARALSPIGKSIGNLTNGVMRKFKDKPAVQTMSALSDFANQQSDEVVKYIDNPEMAFDKIISAIRKDFGDQADDVIETWKKTESPLIESFGSKVKSLAIGSSQYEGGRKGAERYFDDAIPKTTNKLEESITKNVSGDVSYFETVDDILKKGRAKASPLYEEAYAQSITDNNILKTPEIQSALKAAYRKYPTELSGANPNSIKALDYAKRELDDAINEAQRQGKGNFSRSRISIKNKLLEEMDAASPAYKQARDASGDYLALTNAMDDGKSFLRTDRELLAKAYKGYSAAEKTAYKSGVGKALRDKMDSKAGFNAYRDVFKKNELKLMELLSPKEFEGLAKDAKAMQRMFELKKDVIGGSSTSKNEVARELIDGDDAMEAAITSGASIPKSLIQKFMRNRRLGLNDRMAEDISNILYETSPTNKLKLIEAVGRSKILNPQEKKTVKALSFEIDDIFNKKRKQTLKSRLVGGAMGGQAPFMIDAQGNEYYTEEQQ